MEDRPLSVALGQVGGQAVEDGRELVVSVETGRGGDLHRRQRLDRGNDDLQHFTRGCVCSLVGVMPLEELGIQA